ncbi:MAG TPA: sulfatase-like hydrolase/transferase [Vicinamibacterales bacterium]|nr:sulfatase-like hydrolase/transferase [Vicinamibacterales bacterium]
MSRKKSKARQAPRPAPRRRALTPVLVALACVVAIVSGVWLLRSRAAAVRPFDGPIVLVSIDTLRADHLPIYGYTKVRTPNIDGLAAQSTVFEHAYSHAPQTLPAHTSILTGELPFQTQVRDNVGFTLKKDQWTLARALKGDGFDTGGFVSAYVLRAATGINQGFDTYDDDLPEASSEKPLGQVQRDGALTLAAAERWLGRRTSDRLFLFVHFYEPHRPYTPPARFAAYAPYDGEIAYADELVGRLFDRLRAEHLFDKAAIVLLADHGEGLGDHGEQEHGMFLYDDTVHVPLVVKLPYQRAGRRVAEPVQQIDVAPTLLALAGSKPPADLHGRNLRPLLDGSGTIPETGIYAEAMESRYHFGWSELYSLTDARYRLIRAPRDELYDLQNDPREAASIVSARAQVHQAMRAALERLIAGTPITAPSTVSEADRQRLEALGYVGTSSGVSLALPGDRLPDPKDKLAVLERYQRAQALAGARKYDQAAALYRQVLATDPEMLDVWTQLAQADIRLGRHADAVDAYRQMIQRDPKNTAALIGAGDELLRLKRFDEARQYGALAVSVAPALAHELLAKIAVQRKDAVDARREAALAHQADPSVPLPDIVEGMLLYDAGHYDQALPHFMAAHAALEHRTVQMPDVNYYIGDCLGRLNRYDEAQKFLRTEVRLFPFNARARAGLAMLYRATGNDAGAEAAIEEMLRVTPADGRPLAIQLWTMFGEPKKAAALKTRPSAR